MQNTNMIQEWEQYLIYSIDEDTSANYAAEKIIFHYENLKTIEKMYEVNQKLIIYGLFGDPVTVQAQINKFYGKKQFSFKKAFTNEEKGILVAVQDPEILIFCLLVSVQYLIQKPLNVRSLEISLFRILQDLTQTIVACLNQNVLENWYIGENIPFNEKPGTELKQYQIIENEEENIDLEKSILSSLVTGHDGWEIVGYQDNSPFLLLYRNKQLEKKEIKEFEKTTLLLFLEITLDCFNFQKCENLQPLLNKHLPQIFKSPQVISKISEFHDIIQNKINLLKRQNNNNNQEIIKHLTFIIENFEFNEGQQNMEEAILQKIIKNQDLQKSNFLLLQKIFQQEIKPFYESTKNEFLKEQDTKNKIVIQRCCLETIRNSDQKSSIRKVTLSTIRNEFYIDDLKIFNKGGQEQSVDDQIKVVTVFKSINGQRDILILQKYSCYIAFIISNDIVRKITHFEQIQYPCFQYVQMEEQEQLYCFNYNKNQIARVIFDDQGKILKDEIFFDHQKNHIIKQITFLPCKNSFFALNDQGQVLKWTQDLNQFEKIKCIEILPSDNNILEKDFQPSKYQNYQYCYIHSCPNGRLLFLSNFYIIDVYDLNCEMIFSIEFKGKLNFFTDSTDGFCMSLENKFEQKNLKTQEILVFKKLASRKRVQQMNEAHPDEIKEGNPFFDIMKAGHVKYGPISNFLCPFCSVKINIHILNYEHFQEKIIEYLKIRDLDETCNIYFKNDQDCFLALQQEVYETQLIFQIAKSRVPLQICTIENNHIVPLMNGFRIQNNFQQQIAIKQRVKLLSLGFIEDYLTNLSKSIYVVSIFGRQSSGKSYLLNRIFGTRFAVGASRCTDGIWASLAFLQDANFLILDCEGLFSRQRKPIEETQLLALLAGICDMTILNQDLSFNRNLDSLLESLTCVVGKLKGEQLFQGQLLIALRDVNKKDNVGAEEELLKSIHHANLSNQKQSNFMKMLFNQRFIVQQLQNFEHINFPFAIEKLKKSFLDYHQTSKHWQIGKILIETIKILLIQLETKDDESADQIHQRMQIDEIVEISLNNWICLEVLLIFSYQGKQFENNNYKLWDYKLDLSCFQSFCQVLIQQIEHDLQIFSSIDFHSQNLTKIQGFLDILIKQRYEFILKEFDNKINILKVTDQKDFILKERIQLIRLIDEQRALYKLCFQQCSSCYLNCSKMAIHSRQLQNQIHIMDREFKELKTKIGSETTSNYFQKKIDQELKPQFLKLENESNQVQLQINFVQVLKNYLNLKNQKNKLYESLKKDELFESEEQNTINAKKLKQKFEKFHVSEDDKFSLQLQQEAQSIENCQTILKEQQKRLEKFLQECEQQLSSYKSEIELLQIREKRIKHQLSELQNQFSKKDILMKQLSKQLIELNNQLTDLKVERKKKETQIYSLLERQWNFKFEEGKFIQIAKYNFHNSKSEPQNQQLVQKDSMIFSLFLNFQEIRDINNEQLKQIVIQIQQINITDNYDQIKRFELFIKQEQEELESEILEIIEFSQDIKALEFKIKSNQSRIDSHYQELEKNEFEIKQRQLEQQALLHNFRKRMEQFESIQNNKQNLDLLKEYEIQISQRQELFDIYQKFSLIKLILETKSQDKQRFKQEDLERIFKEQHLQLSINVSSFKEAILKIDEMLMKQIELIAQFDKKNIDLTIAQEVLQLIKKTNNQNQFKIQMLIKFKKHIQSENDQINLDLMKLLQTTLMIKIKINKIKNLNECLQLKIQIFLNCQSITKQNEIIILMQNDLQKVTEQANDIQINIQKFYSEQTIISNQIGEKNNQYNQILSEQHIKGIKRVDLQQIIQKIFNFEKILQEYQQLCQKMTEAQSQIQKMRIDSKKYLSMSEKQILDETNKLIEKKNKLDQQIQKIDGKILHFEEKIELIAKASNLQKSLEELRKQEKNQHSCLRENHSCDQLCIICSNENLKCSKKAGHPDEHLCQSQEHYCQQVCEIKGCPKICKKKYHHSGEHQCSNLHLCEVPCEWCGSTCQFDVLIQHKIHQCSQKGCIQNCVLCKRQCAKGHEHTRQPRDAHFCDNIHSCNQKCSVPGICTSGYEEEKRVWKTAISNFEYTYFKQIDAGKQPCTIEIPIGEKNHINQHQCEKESHRCGVKCPECDGLCSKKYGHSGLHSAAQHRNKENQIFTTNNGVIKNIEIIENTFITKKYQIGESSSPETCTDSCSRRLNSHYHLVRCQQGQKCLEKSGNKNARHQKASYEGFDKIEFDEVLCIEFWKLSQWEHPVQDGNKLANIERCNYYCSICTETNKQFCKNQAWHTQSAIYKDHQFQCKEAHLETMILGIDIVFVLDVTGSMKPYIDQAKTMIQNIMEKATNLSKVLRFGIVAYRDHPPQDSSFVTQVNDFDNKEAAIQFLDVLVAEGGGDFPEAVLDGLQAAIELSWMQKHTKMIFLIGDAPPHGKQYGKDLNWPYGCPCKIDEKILFQKMKNKNIDFQYLKQIVL